MDNQNDLKAVAAGHPVIKFSDRNTGIYLDIAFFPYYIQGFKYY